MATTIYMPQRSNSATSYLLSAWTKKVGEAVKVGDVLCEIETDKAIVEVESQADGVLLAQLYQAGDDVPVLVPIAVVGQPGEDATPAPSQAALIPASQAAPPPLPQATPPPSPSATAPSPKTQAAVPAPMSSDKRQPISPRARALAQFANLDLSQVVIQASGPEGRIIERDIRRTLSQQPRLTRAASAQEAPALPDQGTGLGGRITRADLDALQKITPPAANEELPPIPMRGTRKVIAERMLASLQTTAQLTLNAWADARALLSLRARLKASPESLGLRQVTVNDLILFTVSRVLPDFPALNAHLRPDAIQPYARVHLGFAVDTARGLLVPVIHDAHALSLRRLAQEAGRLAESASGGKIDPADLEGGTFTVTNLGSLGVEHFTPVLNPPQVAILGVGAVALRPVGPLDGSATQHLPHLPLSLTVDHQAVDGAPAARFLQALSQALAQVDLLMAL